LEKDGRIVVFRVLVDAGTYIRKLCFDMGEAMGTGMSMVELRRIRSGQFTEKDAYTLNQLAYSMYEYKQGDDQSVYNLFLPVEMALTDMPMIVVRETAVPNLYKGAPLTAPGVLCVSKSLQPSAEAAVFSQEGELVEVASINKDVSEIVSAKNGIVAVPIRVLQPIRGNRPNC
jgi:H/ACA ribonucleoprotein complex subunit 4